MVIALVYMSEEEFQSRLIKIQNKNLTKARKARLKAEKEKYKPKRKLPSTSKLVLLVVFLLCIEIIIFSEYAMLVLGDASAMYVLIGVPTTLVPTVISYYNKSRAENTRGGITFETVIGAKLNEEQEDVCIEDAEG